MNVLLDIIFINPLNTSGLFHCYMMDDSVCHFRGVGSIMLPLIFFFLVENPVSKQCRPWLDAK